jgi:putative drug exporter of the RND superfamily
LTTGTRQNSLDGAFEALGRFVVRFRWFVVAFWILVVIVVSAAFPSLGSEVDNNNSAFLSPSAPSTKAADLATPLIGSGASGNVTEITLIAVANRPLTAADVGAITHEVTLARGVNHVLSASLLGVSADGEAAQIRVRAAVALGDIPTQTKIVNGLQRTFGQAKAPAGLKFHLAGQVPIQVANQQSSNKSTNEVQAVSFLFVIVLLLVVFRSLPAAIMTLLPSGFALAISTRLIGGLGEAGVKVSSITEVLLIVLLIGAGTDYGLFLVFRVREELRDGTEPREAVQRALVRVGESITGSAGTVILALLTLLFASFGLYHDLGIPLAVGVAVMLLLGLTLLPALLAILGRRAFWPSKIEPGPQREGLWGRIATRLVRHPKTTLVVGVLVFLALAAGALGYKAGGFGGDVNPPKGSDAAIGDAALAKHFPQTSSNPANVVFAYNHSLWTDPRPIDVAGGALESSRAFKQLAGPLNPNGTPLTVAQLQALYHKLGPPQELSARQPPGTGFSEAVYNAYRVDSLFISRDGRTIQFEADLTAGGQSSTSAMNATPDIRSVVASAAHVSGARQSGVAGEAAAVYDINKNANHDLKTVVPIAIVAIGLLLGLVLRSAIAPLYLIVSVALSYLASLGIATIVFIDIGGEGGISFVLPFLMFIFLLALGEDYNILVMTRIREEARTLPLQEAVIKAIGRTGSTVTSAGLILGGTFAVFAIVGGSGSGGSELRAIGFGLAAGILMDTFLVRTLLVPAVVTLLGRWNWWPSQPGRTDG